MARIEKTTKRYPSDLTDAEWDEVAPLLPPPAQRGRKRSVDLREVLNAIRYMVRSGCEWRMLPAHFPPWQTVYWWFCRFVRLLLFRTIHDVVLMVDRERAGRTPEPSAAILDSQWRALAAGEMAIGEASRDRARMARVLAWLHAHYAEPLRLAPLTEIAHLSESQLQRMFRRGARMSLSAYVTQLRVGHACRLLIQTDRSVGSIAVEAGFSDAAHFARHFRAAKGMTATRYRAGFCAERAP